MEALVRRTAEAAAVAALAALAAPPLLGLALAARVLFDLGAAFDFGMMGNIQYVLILIQ